MTHGLRTRFAPAPTGRLHLGHVANALYVWGLGGVLGRRVLLRIEDHDRQRSRSEYERALLDDLDWLGFEADDFPTDAFRAGAYDGRQSDRAATYETIARDLSARGLLYACTCSRQPSAGAADGVVEARGYPGTCRDRGIRPDADVTWRVRIEPGVETFDDLLLGPQRQSPADTFGDPVIRDRRGNWAYQFAVTADDWLQDVDLVIRGRDLLASTGLQIRLGRLLGRPQPPAFAHHPLIMKTASQKLSKWDGDTGVDALRHAGWTPAAVAGEAAFRVGLLPERREVRAGTAGARELFSDFLRQRP